ncbi:hypothetical protein G7046_g93 [Stylonectria norvegica]|nr:hypothetical protein G7046_g93 [Stylonectria norvegica]
MLAFTLFSLLLSFSRVLAGPTPDSATNFSGPREPVTGPKEDIPVRRQVSSFEVSSSPTRGCVTGPYSSSAPAPPNEPPVHGRPTELIAKRGSRNPVSRPDIEVPVRRDGVSRVSPALNLTSTDLEARDDTTYGGYKQSCKDIRYYLDAADNKDPGKMDPYLQSPYLVAHCPADDGTIKCTHVAIGSCISNHYGGEFHKSCYQCRLMEDDTTLFCRCNDPEPRKDKPDKTKLFMVETAIDLDLYIHNKDGELICYGEGGGPEICPDTNSYDVFKGGQWWGV